MVQPQLSVIIPSHNRPHMLPLVARSALKQTYSDLEVVDDASDPPVQHLGEQTTLWGQMAIAGSGIAGTEVGTHLVHYIGQYLLQIMTMP